MGLRRKSNAIDITFHEEAPVSRVLIQSDKEDLDYIIDTFAYVMENLFPDRRPKRDEKIDVV
jgi:hypothetical protein